LGVEVLKGVSWAISPFFRIKTPISISVYYRFYVQEPGNEELLKPKGPSIQGTFSLSKNLDNLRINGYINSLYNRKDGFSWNFGLNLLGSF